MTKRSHLERFFNFDYLKNLSSFREAFSFSWETFQRLIGLSLIKEIASFKGEQYIVEDNPVLSENLSFLTNLSQSQLLEFQQMLDVQVSKIFEKNLFLLEIDRKSQALEKTLRQMIFARQCFSREQFTSLYEKHIPLFVKRIMQEKKAEVFDSSALKKILQKFIWLGVDSSGNKHFFIMPEVGYFIGSDGEDFDISILEKIAPAHPAELILNPAKVENFRPILIDYEILLDPMHVLSKNLLKISKAKKVDKCFDKFFLSLGYIKKYFIYLDVPKNDIIEEIYIPFSQEETRTYSSYKLSLRFKLKESFYKDYFRQNLWANEIKILRAIHNFFVDAGFSYKKDFDIDTQSLDITYESKNTKAAFSMFDSTCFLELVLHRVFVDKNIAEVNAQPNFDSPNASVFLLNDFILFANIIYDIILRLDEEEEA